LAREILRFIPPTDAPNIRDDYRLLGRFFAMMQQHSAVVEMRLKLG
jgi:hypothetical protein